MGWGEGERQGPGVCSCRGCGTPLSLAFADLGLSPIANALRRAEDNGRPEIFYPLQAWVCERCWLVQLHHKLKPEELFSSSYAYFSSYSSSWLEHARVFAEEAITRFALKSDSMVVEVASNDGYLLQYFKRAGIRIQGVEPAANVADVAERERGVPSLRAFFGRDTALKMRASGLVADLMVANNVLAHVPDVNDFLAGFAILLKPEGVASFEFPHLLRLIEDVQFDTIYHEHYSYLSLLAVETLLARQGLRAFDVEALPTHGGSLRLLVCRTMAPYSPTPALAALRAAEAAAGLNRTETYLAFTDRIRRTRRSLLRFLIQAQEEGSMVAGYGAPAKGNTLLNYCGVDTSFIAFTVDRSPHKQGTWLPGTRIPVLAPNAIDVARPDYLLILPWNLADEIMEHMAHVREWGCRFVVPIPETRILA